MMDRDLSYEETKSLTEYRRRVLERTRDCVFIKNHVYQWQLGAMTFEQAMACSALVLSERVACLESQLTEMLMRQASPSPVVISKSKEG